MEATNPPVAASRHPNTWCAQRTKTDSSTDSTLSVIWGCAGFEDRIREAERWYRELLREMEAVTEGVDRQAGLVHVRFGRINAGISFKQPLTRLASASECASLPTSSIVRNAFENDAASAASVERKGGRTPLRCSHEAEFH